MGPFIKRKNTANTLQLNHIFPAILQAHSYASLNNLTLQAIKQRLLIGIHHYFIDYLWDQIILLPQESSGHKSLSVYIVCSTYRYSYNIIVSVQLASFSSQQCFCLKFGFISTAHQATMAIKPRVITILYMNNLYIELAICSTNL